MANVDQGNLVHIDTAANDIRTDGVLVHHVTFTATTAAGTLELLDASGGAELISWHSSTVDTKFFDYTDRPLSFPKGLHATLTNGKATLLVSKLGSGK